MSYFSDIVRSMPPVTKNLIIVNFIIWLAMMVSPSLCARIMDFCALHFYEADSFNLVQPFTYMFLHSTQSLAHIFFNMFTLFMFGITLERVMDSKRFLLYYVVCGVGAALIQEAVWALTLKSTIVDGLAQLNGLSADTVREWIARDPSILSSNYNFFQTVGASGAIYGILLAFAMLFPNRPLYFMFIPVPIKAKWMMLIWGGAELLLGLGSATDGVAHFAHLGGMIFGLALILYWRRSGTLHGDMY